MAMRKQVFSDNEWYHCFTRGVDKRTIFLDTSDYERFLMLMYACNNTRSLHISNLGTRHQGPALGTVLASERGDQLVDIGVYCLMPNHFHILLRQREEGGISLFMQKIGTGYTMYFNKKNARTGALFSSRFKAAHVADNQYLQRVVNYIHGNPAEILEPEWKNGVVRDPGNLEKYLRNYPYSSLIDYGGDARLHKVILNTEAIHEVSEENPTFDTIIEDARIYYRLSDSV